MNREPDSRQPIRFTARARARGRPVDPKTRDGVDRLCAGLDARRDLLIEHLHRIQDALGHLPPAHLVALAERLNKASGLNWGDIDLANARAHVRRSYNSGALGKPKTKSSRRTVMLPPEVVEVLSQIQPLHVSPDDPVFVNRDGLRIDRKHFSPTWNGCLRVAGVRLRGIYACKDTCITLGRLAGASWAHLETQSGVREATLVRHYYAFLPNEVPDEFEKIRSWEQGRRESSQPQPHQPQTLTSKTAS